MGSETLRLPRFADPPRDASEHPGPVQTPLAPFPGNPRAATIADLARHLGELAAAGDLEAARVVSQSIAALLGLAREAASVVDIATKRRER